MLRLICAHRLLRVIVFLVVLHVWAHASKALSDVSLHAWSASSLHMPIYTYVCVRIMSTSVYMERVVATYAYTLSHPACMHVLGSN